MLREKTIKDFFVQVMIVWGISIACVSIMCLIFGDAARENSSFFALGSAGLPIATIAQFWLFAVVVTMIQWICFTDLLFKNLGLTLRRILMFTGVPVAGGAFAFCFRWFPVKEPKAWISFLICYAVCTTVSVYASDKLDRKENLQLQNALERLQANDEEGRAAK